MRRSRQGSVGPDAKARGAPLLVFTHGSRDRGARREFLEVVNGLRQRLAGSSAPPSQVVPCYLLHGRPGLRTALRGVADGNRHAVIVPHFFFRAMTLKSVVPRVVRESPGDLEVTVTGPLWPHPLLLEILARRVAAAGRGSGTGGPGTVLLVASGSTDRSVLREIRSLGRALSNLVGRPVVVAFFDVSRPRARPAAEALLRDGAGPLTVIPLALTHGLQVQGLVRDLRAVGGGRAARVTLTEPAGLDPRVSEIMAERYLHARAT